MTPFTVTIKITEATQCHQVVSQLLRVFPTLSLTIIANETEPVTSRPPQTIGFADIPALVAACIAGIYPRADPRRFRDACDNSYRIFAQEARRLGADEARQAASPSYPWKPGEHTEAAAVARAEADAIHSQNIAECKAAAAKALAEKLHRRDDNPDAGPV